MTLRKWTHAATAIGVLAFGAAIGLLATHDVGGADRPRKTFTPPSAAERQRAIGSTDKLIPALRRAFDPGPEFQPIPTPGPSDWLANHDEPGQTYEQFARARPNRPDRRRHTIYLLPLGEFDPETSPALKELTAFAAAYFNLDVKRLPAVKLAGAGLTSRKNRGTGRVQYLTRDLLALLRRKLPADGYCLLGITMRDLYPEESWNYVFGQASLRSRVGVYSFARYDPAFFGERRGDDVRRLMLGRSLRVLAHETSHMFGMHHCIYFRCVVNGSNNLPESDAQPLHFCPLCLRKLQASVGFDVQQRYRRLQKVYRRAGLKEEAQWVKQRLDRIAAP